MIWPRQLYAFIFCGISFTVLGFPDQQVKEDTNRVNLLNRMAFSLRESDPSLAMSYSQDALTMAEKIDYPLGKARALNNLGWVYYRKSDFVKALKYTIEAIKLSEQIGALQEVGTSHINLSAVYFEQKQYQKSVPELNKALAIGEATQDKRMVARVLNNLAYLYMTGKGNADSSEYYAIKARKASEQASDSYLTSFALRTLGDAMAARHKTDEAIDFYLKAISIADKNKNNSMSTATSHRLAKAYITQGRSEEALQILTHNAEVASSLGYREELERTYKVMAELYRTINKPSLAYEYLDKYNVLHDSIYSQQSSEQLALLQSQYELDLKQAQIELLTKDAVLKQDEIGKQRLQLYVTILTATSALLLVLVLTYSFQKSKRVNRALKDQKEQLAAKNAEIEEKRIELSRLNATKDKLFSIIGHDFRSPLHSLKGLLSLIGNKNMTQVEFEKFSIDLRKKIDVVYDNLDNILNWSVTQLKGISTSPTVIEPQALAAEVFELYDEMARSKNVQLVNEIPKGIFAVADKDQIRLVLRNLISNALKFTASGHVRLSAERDDREIQVTVEDTGMGIAEADIQKLFIKDALWSAQGTRNEKGLGLGLLLCKEFIEKNQGTLRVESEQGSGTTIRFTLPTAKGKNLRPEFSGDVKALEGASLSA